MGATSPIQKEILINNNQIIFIPLNLLKTFKSLCKIEYNDKIGSGFFIKLEKKNEDFFCLITNEHVITKDMIEKKEKITFYYDSEEKVKEIYLNRDDRIIKDFINMNIDITVIEILPDDNIKKKYFLLPDKNYINEFNELINKDIVILQYPRGKPGISIGKIKKIDNYEFTHLASTEYGSSGSPIFLENNTKVIGINKSGKKDNENNKSENYGDFIGPIFNYFKNFSLNDYNNEYNIEIKKENIKEDNISNNKLNEMTIIYNIKKYKYDI